MLEGILLISLLFAPSDTAESTRNCLILSTHQKRAAEALHRWTQPKPFDYVEGEYPRGMKFHYEIGDKVIRQIQASGGKVVILKSGYSLAELQDARQQCKAFQESK